MKLKTIVLPALAVAGASALLTPPESHGFSTIGGSLGQSQRDFRVYNNITGGGANNNTVIDPNFPGYDGAEAAIWKGCIEWSSELHGGDGAGDPTQAIGNGGANFDSSWQGNATSVGTTDQNVHSQISGNGGSTLAFTETPISDGWRIRYYEDPWNWKDGPGSVSVGVDLQGVACHEYGHALGLGHSTSGGATMFPSISGSGDAQRSINGDDQSGVQFIYGVMDTAKKPHIDTVSGTNPIIITGFNFAATANEVWFTQASAGGNGTPVKVTGLNSDGFTITVVPPGNAGPGDLLVKKGGVTGHKGPSNLFPWSPAAIPTDPFATDLNIDIGTGFGAPSNSYGAAAGSAGAWNSFSPPVAGVPLVDLAGDATAATISTSSTGGEFSQNNAATIGDDEALLDDLEDVGCTPGVSTSTWTINGMAAGVYDVYVYGWAPDDRTGFSTDITVAGGAMGAQNSGAFTWAGSHVEGGTYVVDTVTVAADGGAISVTTLTNTGCGSINGIQIVEFTMPSCGTSVNYCTSGLSASWCQAALSSSGSASASAASGFDVIATGVEGNKDGLYFWGTNGRQSNTWGSGTSFQCVAPPVKRAGLLVGNGTNGGCDGVFSQDLNALWQALPAKNPGAGAIVQLQLWYRDPFNTSNQTTSLSDALEFTLCP